MVRYSGKKILVVVLFCLASAFAEGQIMNIEKFRLDSLSRKNPFRLKLEANFDFYNRSATAEEQAEFVALGSEISSVYAPGKHFYMLLGEVSYVENNASKILNNGNVHLRSTFYYREKFSPELFGQAQYDDFRGLSDRFIFGGALRWNAIRKKKFMLTLGTGPMYEFERWSSPIDNETVEVTFLKVSNNLIVRWSIGEHIDFNSILYYQVGYDNEIEAPRNRISNSTNLNFRINTKIAFKTGLRLAYEDRPIVPITKFIYSVENGISLNF
jgi:putative salt-induced outer membrane protein YdiY